MANSKPWKAKLLLKRALVLGKVVCILIKEGGLHVS